MPETTSFDIRQVPASDPASFELSNYAFDASPRDMTEADRAFDGYLADMKLFVSYDGDSALAKVGVHPMTMNVRGKILDMGGIGGVATMPAGRRGGRIRALMAHAYQDMRNEGQPVSTLYPFRESFYERLGYVSFPAPLYLQAKPADLAPLMRLDHTATIEHLRIADGFEEWTAFLRRYQESWHGFSIHGETPRASIRDKNAWWLTLVREGGDLTGAMTYRILGENKPMHVKTFFATTLAARYRLLEWIGRHVDQTPSAQIPLMPGDDPELWWHDLGDDISSSGTDAWGPAMGRIVSVDALSGIGAGDGEVALEITDQHASWNAGVWTFRGSAGELEVTQGGSTAAELSIQGLSALVFNGIDPDLLPFRGWGTVDAATADALRSLFPPVRPYLYEQF